jgi:signal transduction histidine kinase
VTGVVIIVGGVAVVFASLLAGAAIGRRLSKAGPLDVVPAAEAHAFHAMADAGIVLTPSGRVLAMNDAALRMVPHVKRGEVLAEADPELAADVARVAEGYTDRPHGEQAWWLRVVSMRSPTGRSLGMLVLLTDSAEKRAFEQRIVELNRDLRQTVRELEAATRAKDRFIANASHEFRTPLQSVIGYTQRLLFERVGPLHKAQRDELEIVERSARHLLAVIESLLDITQLEAGEVQATAAPFDAGATATQVIEAVDPLATAKGIRLSVTAEGLGEIVSDETKLRQILLNLVANAVKFTPEGDVTLDCRRDQGYAVFRVTDTGPGIPQEELERIFEAFHRVRSSTIDGVGGSGLGLYVSNVLATMLGGELDVESVLGEGSAFTLVLPVDAVWEQASAG